MKYGFVILHYLVSEVTKQCVDSILTKFQEDIEVVIVDNASPNNSGALLKDYYSNYTNVEVLINNENAGFARGNNIGYKYLRENGLYDFIIVMNNDVMIEQEDFLEKINSIYHQTQFAVLGPDIYCPAWNVRQNPARSKGLSYARVASLKKSYERWCAHPLIHYIKDEIQNKIKNRSQSEIQGIERISKDNQLENVVLHGACYIFSHVFIRCRDKAFNPGTFLYVEEDILYYECLMSGLKMVYSPDLKVIHWEEISASASTRSRYEKKKRKFQETIKSLSVLEHLMEHEGK